jgi:gamma-D-glutamyl-L-lysine dipeptidyl-peptidase
VKRLPLTVIAGVLLCSFDAAAAAQKAVVIVPVADLRSDQSLPEPGKSDDKQQTQLLFGETVEVVSSSGDWVQIHAIEQPEFTTHQKWEGYPGWVQKSALKEIASSQAAGNAVVTAKWLGDAYERNASEKDLPLGARVRVTRTRKGLCRIDLGNGRSMWTAPALRMDAKSTPRDSLRYHILTTASLLMGDRYIWGGLSPLDETGRILLSGVDCSGLVHLAYRVNGMTVPRDSLDQYLQADKIRRGDLKPADLIFSAKSDNPKNVTHVVLYAGEDQIIEAPQTGMVVRKVSFKEKYGKDLSQTESGQTVGDRILYFGRFLKDH